MIVTPEPISRPGHGEPPDMYDDPQFASELEAWTLEQVLVMRGWVPEKASMHPEVIELRRQVAEQKLAELAVANNLED